MLLNPHRDATYILVTAAYNEEAFIEKTISSIVSQNTLPKKWIIVSDGSTDRTDEIVSDYGTQHSFIQLLRISEEHTRNFAAQVNAINAGLAQSHGMEYDFIGNVDADVSFPPSYYSHLLEKFEQDPCLGLAGGFILEEHAGQFCSRRTNRTRSVAHAVQLFRRECLEAAGGYLPLRYGGPDWHAEVTARMNGWHVQAFPELKVFHHRATGTADVLLRHCFRQGRMDYSFGSLPLFEFLKCIRRFPERPFVGGGLARMAGFLWSSCTGEQREVSREFVDFLRGEQAERLYELKLWLSPRTIKRGLDN